MYMASIGSSTEAEFLRELSGARVLITGLNLSMGVDVARAYADLSGRLVVQTNELSPEMTELFALLSQSATDIRLHTSAIRDAEDAVRFAQAPAQAFGGLDAVINFAMLDPSELARLESEADIDALLDRKLTPLAQLTRVISNRMRVVMSEGMILNVLAMPHIRSRRDAAIAGYARTALAALTRHEAQAWAGQGIRINGVGPRIDVPGSGQGACVMNDPDLAALALYLSSRRGRTHSGHVFDADGL